MNRFARRTLMIALVALIVGAMPSSAAGGGTVPSADPADQAAEAYNRGLAHRDKAWELEEQAESSADVSQRTKLEAKAQKEYGKAIRAFRSATESDPQMHQAFGSLGYALRKTGQYEDSLAAYNQALELEPGYTEAIEYRAEAFLGLNRLEEAKEAYMKLFRDDRERADELMAAMQGWVEARLVDPGEFDPAAIDEFSIWVRDRAEVSGHTADVQSDSDRGW
jgi:tetratricopeptide (TPR) repeat protein